MSDEKKSLSEKIQDIVDRERAQHMQVPNIRGVSFLVLEMLKGEVKELEKKLAEAEKQRDVADDALLSWVRSFGPGHGEGKCVPVATSNAHAKGESIAEEKANRYKLELEHLKEKVRKAQGHILSLAHNITEGMMDGDICMTLESINNDLGGAIKDTEPSQDAPKRMYEYDSSEGHVVVYDKEPANDTEPDPMDEMWNKCRGPPLCKWFNPRGNIGEGPYCAYSSEGHCQYEPASEPEGVDAKTESPETPSTTDEPEPCEDCGGIGAHMEGCPEKKEVL